MQRFAQHCCFTSGIVMLQVLPFARSSCCATCSTICATDNKEIFYGRATNCSRDCWNEQYCNVAQKAVAWICCPCNPLRPNNLLFSWFYCARSVKNCYILVLLEVHEAYVLACTLVTVFLLLLFTGLYIKMLCFISKQGIFNLIVCVWMFFLKNFEVWLCTVGKCTN